MGLRRSHDRDGRRRGRCARGAVARPAPDRSGDPAVLRDRDARLARGAALDGVPDDGCKPGAVQRRAGPPAAGWAGRAGRGAGAARAPRAPAGGRRGGGSEWAVRPERLLVRTRARALLCVALGSRSWAWSSPAWLPSSPLALLSERR